MKEIKILTGIIILLFVTNIYIYGNDLGTQENTTIDDIEPDVDNNGSPTIDDIEPDVDNNGSNNTGEREIFNIYEAYERTERRYGHLPHFIWENKLDFVDAEKALKTDEYLKVQNARIRKRADFQINNIAPIIGESARVAAEAGFLYFGCKFLCGSKPLPTPKPGSPLPHGLPKLYVSTIEFSTKTLSNIYIERPLKNYYRRQMNRELLEARQRRLDEISIDLSGLIFWNLKLMNRR